MTTTTAGTADNRRLLNKTGSAVAGALVMILAGALWGVMTHEIPEKNHDIVLMLMNTVSNAVIGIVGYFFGASVTSAQRQGDMTVTATSSKDADKASASVAPLAVLLVVLIALFMVGCIGVYR